jgi:branched-subunit amino acid aminotransferase/4-amino-4-deoxychorismate lyase
MGFDEVLSTSDGPCFWEGSRTNLFLISDDSLITPALSGPIVPGIMRGLVLELARLLRVHIREVRELDLRTLEEAHEVFLTNSVRGLIPVSRLGDMTWDVVPGRLTYGLADYVSQWLNQGETR